MGGGGGGGGGGCCPCAGAKSSRMNTFVVSARAESENRTIC